MSGPVKYHTGGFPPKSLAWEESLVPLLGPAAGAVTRYDGMLAAIPNASVLLSPLTTHEAVLSSRIEGTQATMGEVLEFEAGAGPEQLSSERREDIAEIINYRLAMHHAEQMLEQFPLSIRVIREVHQVLLKGVRGESKAPGEFRKVPNWIGPTGTPMEQARYVPIGADALPEAMSRWELYIHEEPKDVLVQLAILHAEFEALHPFLDGNGRLGRMLVPLFLWQKGLIRRPTFYISEYFESNRDEYYDRLLAVSKSGDWTGWCQFFLRAVKTQAEENLKRTSAILDLYNELKPILAKLTHSQFAIHALDWMFKTPVFSSADFASHAGIPGATARRILPLLRDNGILLEIRKGGGRTPAVFGFGKLLLIAEGKGPLLRAE